MSANAAYVRSFYREYDLPWSVAPADRQRFNRLTLQVLGATLVLALVVPVLPTRDIASERPPEVPERFVKLVIERQKPPPPPAVVVPEPPRPEPEPVVQEQEAPKPEPKPEVKPPEPKPQPKPEPTREQQVAKAKEQASKTGVMAFADQLAELRQHTAVATAATPRNLSDAVGATARTERSLVTAGAGAASGGINTASLSRNTGGTTLAARATTAVESDVAVAEVRSEAAAADDPRGAQRSREEIEMVFDRNKAAIYALYRRALREDPTLQGKLVLRLTIAPSGAVTACEIVSSELGAPELEARLVQRIRLFDFGAKDVSEVTTTKPIEFFPA